MRGIHYYEAGLPSRIAIVSAPALPREQAHGRRRRVMENRWSYKNYQIKDGLKPGSRHFQYFYVVSEEGKKRSSYCVWIEDEALSRFEEPGDFASIVSTQRESWDKWVKGKIDEGDFGSKVLKFGPDGVKEIELSEMSAHLSME
jgi:hypothetical protein